MSLFGKEDTALAVTVGELKARVTALETALALVKANPTTVAPPMDTMPPKVEAVIKALAKKDIALYRHLSDEARGMLLFPNVDEDQVCASLISGSPRH